MKFFLNKTLGSHCRRNLSRQCRQHANRLHPTMDSTRKRSVKERLTDLSALEEKVKPSLNVRAGLYAYITADKKERGGSSHLGDTTIIHVC
jgi:hypothetical protein